jgi:hypothetical protein
VRPQAIAKDEMAGLGPAAGLQYAFLRFDARNNVHHSGKLKAKSSKSEMLTN